MFDSFQNYAFLRENRKKVSEVGFFLKKDKKTTILFYIIEKVSNLEAKSKYYNLNMKQLSTFYSFMLLLLLSTGLMAQPCPPSVSLNIQQTNVSCFGGNNGSATVSVIGGSGNYTYTWTPSVSTTQTASNLTSGTYNVSVANLGGGGGTQTVYSEDFDGVQTWAINQSSGANDTDYNLWVIGDGEGGVLPPNCGVGGNGNNTLHVSNQLDPTSGATYNAGGICFVGICVVTNMRAESPNISTMGYTGMTLAFDYIGNGQGLTDNASLLYSINGGTSWNTLSPSLKSTTCPSGQGQWAATSFILPAACENIPNLKIAFNWTNNDDGVGADPSFAVNNVVITSGSGGGGTCFVNGSVTITQPASALGGTAQITPPSCSSNAGSASVAPSGGTSPYTYSWSNGQTTASVNNLAPGVYTCTITDSKGCTFPVTVAMPAAQQLMVNSTPVNVSCGGGNNGAITLSPINGTAPYTYSWSSGQSTAAVTGLTAGNYVCLVTDAAGCSTTVNVTLTAPSVLNLNTSAIPVSCFGQLTGSATANATGGIMPYFYSWSNGLSGATVQNLAAGNYTCIVTDANNCTTNQSVTVSQPSAALTATATSTPTSTGNAIGTATASPAGGTSPYTYSWNTVPAQTTVTATGLAAGVYACQVTDANGCKVTVSVGVEATLSVNPQTLGITAWNIYPNPVKDQLNLSISLSGKENITVSIYDLTGKLIFSGAENGATTFQKLINVSSWAQGVYWVKIQTGKGSFTEKLLVE